MPFIDQEELNVLLYIAREYSRAEREDAIGGIKKSGAFWFFTGDQTTVGNKICSLSTKIETCPNWKARKLE